MKPSRTEIKRYAVAQCTQLSPQVLQREEDVRVCVLASQFVGKANGCAGPRNHVSLPLFSLFIFVKFSRVDPFLDLLQSLGLRISVKI